MGERPDDEVRRGDPLDSDPLDRRDPLVEGGRDPSPLGRDTEFDPATEAFDPEAVNRGSALRDEAEVDEIEVTRMEIERTRADMSETVDAIQQRLSPENLKEQAKDRVREATVGRAQGAGSSIMETIRANPLPAALTGIGLSWLFVSGRRQRSGQPRYQQGRRYAYDYSPPTPYDYPRDYEEERGTSGSSAGEALEQTRERAGEAASRAQDRVEETASRAQDRAGQAADRAQDQASRLGNRVQYQARQASNGFQRMLRENPLTVGALAVGLGAAAGLAVPQTRQEHEVMGEARDSVVEKVQETAQEAQQKVQSVAQEAQSAVQQEAENQGLTNQ